MPQLESEATRQPERSVSSFSRWSSLAEFPFWLPSYSIPAVVPPGCPSLAFGTALVAERSLSSISESCAHRALMQRGQRLPGGAHRALLPVGLRIRRVCRGADQQPVLDF